MQPQDCSSAGVCTDLIRWHQRDQLPHWVSSWKPGSPDRKLSALSFPSSRHQSINNLPTADHSVHTQSRRSTQNFGATYIYCLWRGGIAKPAKKHCHRFYSSLDLPQRADVHNSPFNCFTKPTQEAREIPYLGALLSVPSWFRFWLTASFFPFCLMPSEPTASGKKNRSFTLNTKCSLIYQHTYANTGKNLWAEYNLDLCGEIKCPAISLSVIW